MKTMKTMHVARVVLITALILSIPLVAMQFSDEVDWNLFDFAVIGTLLMGTGLAYEFLALRLRSGRSRLVVGGLLLLLLMLAWAELAVGVFGSPFAGS